MHLSVFEELLIDIVVKQHIINCCKYTIICKMKTFSQKNLIISHYDILGAEF